MWFLIILAIICSMIVFQLILHYSIDSIRERPKLYKVLEWLDALYWDFVIFIVPLIEQPRVQDFVFRVIMTIIGVVLGGLGLYLVLLVAKINKNIGKSDLIEFYDKGVFGFVRHPQYLGMVFMFIGWSFIWKADYCIILSPIFFLFVFMVSKFEEKK